MSTCPYCATEVTHTTVHLDHIGSWAVYQPCGHPAPPTAKASYADLIADVEASERVLADMQRKRSRV